MVRVLMPIPTRRRALELAATFIENDLHEMRRQSIEQHQNQRSWGGEHWDGRELPLGSSHEGDLMKAVEWATSAAILRAMAAQEDQNR